MKQKKKNDIAALLDYAGSHRGLTFLGLGLSAASMVCSMIPYLCIWLAARDLIEVAPNWTQAQSVARYGWLAFGAAFGGIVLYFGGLMCTHLAAFRTAANIRKQGVAHVMNAPLGWFDANASGLIRGRLDAAAADTETLLAHNLADIVGTITLFIAMLVLMFVFDWRMGCACLLAAVISILTMFAMMGGKNAQIMAEYQAAQDRMTKAGTEYVRGIPVVKIFQQTVYSFKAFQQAIEEYSAKAEHYQADVCRTPQSINLSVTEGAFVFLVPAALFLAPGALATGSFAGFVTDFAFYAVFSAIISTALARIMFASSGIMLAGTALGRIRMVMEAPELKAPERPRAPQGSRVPDHLHCGLGQQCVHHGSGSVGFPDASGHQTSSNTDRNRTGEGLCDVRGGLRCKAEPYLVCPHPPEPHLGCSPLHLPLLCGYDAVHRQLFVYRPGHGRQCGGLGQHGVGDTPLSALLSRSYAVSGLDDRAVYHGIPYAGTLDRKEGVRPCLR